MISISDDVLLKKLTQDVQKLNQLVTNFEIGTCIIEPYNNLNQQMNELKNSIEKLFNLEKKQSSKEMSPSSSKSSSLSDDETKIEELKSNFISDLRFLRKELYQADKYLVECIEKISKRDTIFELVNRTHEVS